MAGDRARVARRATRAALALSKPKMPVEMQQKASERMPERTLRSRQAR